MDKAWDLLERHLGEYPNDPLGLTVAVYTLHKAGRNVAAYQFAKRLVEVAPDRASSWTNLGTVCDELWLVDESEQASKRAIALSPTRAEKAHALANLAALLINTGRFKDGEPYAQEAVDIDPLYPLARGNLGMCQLARRDWANGFKNFGAVLGSPTRRKWQFAQEPQWDGSRVDHLIVYGEQGLGDELCFASMIPDAQAKVGRVTIECDKRLANLFRRSFGCTVYGTRYEKQLAWAPEDQKPDASIASGQLGEFLRAKDEDFPGTPFLKADPDRALMWKSLFASKGKPVIGIAWTGGVPKTAAQYRRLRLQDFLPLFRAVDAHWVSLEYKDRSGEIRSWNETHPHYQIHEYPYATRTQDYDDTAGLIAALDCFVGIHTTAMHAAGGLGIPAHVVVSEIPQWRYGESGSNMVWYKDLTLYRKTNKWPMDEIAKNVSRHLLKLAT